MAEEQSGEELKDLASAAPLVEHPDDAFRRAFASRTILGVFCLLATIILACAITLVVSAFRDASSNERILGTIQAVLTTSLGLLGGLASTVAGYFFQSRRL